jgi:hypothetical protein
MELKDVGHKQEVTAVPEGNKEKNKIIYPTLYLPSDVLTGKEVGEMCRLEIVAKITGQQESEDRKETTLEIHKVGYLGKAGKMNKEEYLNASDDEIDKNDRENIEEESEERKETE